MAGSWGNGLKTPVNDLLHKNFKFRPLFGYHNFQNQINTWETTVSGSIVEFQGGSVQCKNDFLKLLHTVGKASSRYLQKDAF